MKAFIDINDKDLERLSFKTLSLSLIRYKPGSEEFELNKVYMLEEDIFNKIRGIFQGVDNVKINKKDRIYILPGNKMTQARIKEFAKHKGAYITKDITKADVILGNDELVGNPDFSVMKNLMCKTSEFYWLPSHYSADDIASKFEIDDLDPDLFKDLGTEKVLLTRDAYMSVGYISGVDYAYDVRFIAPFGMKCLFEILSRGIKVASQKYLLDNAHSGFELDNEEAYGNIDMMLKSSDDSSVELGVELLIHAKIDMDNPMTNYYLYRLSQDHYYKIDKRKRAKNVQMFMDMVGWWNFYVKGLDSFILHMEGNGMLTSQIFKLMLDELIESELYDIASSEFFERVEQDKVYKIGFQLKEQYKKLCEDETI